MMMSCHGYRVLRKRCSKSCVLRPCLDSFESPEAKARATLFVSKFFGRTDLLNFLESVPSHKRNSVGRTVNPVNGVIGLLSTGNWHLCQAGVRTVLAGGTPIVFANSFPIPENDGISGIYQAAGAWSTVSLILRCSDCEEPKLLNLLV